MFKISSQLQDVALKNLRPTQLTVGQREVEAKRREWADLPAKRRQHDMSEQLFPAAKGPKDRFYILDHHHLALALLREGVKNVRVGLVTDLSHLSLDDFWIYLDHRSWVHCYDEKGMRQSFDSVPKAFDHLRDDPFRSLAASVQELGGFAKSDEPFLEFLWANHFRRHIPLEGLEENYERALGQGLKLAHLAQSRHLPGWSGTK